RKPKRQNVEYPHNGAVVDCQRQINYRTLISYDFYDEL
ncbi:MAG: hypothetical protein JWO06_2309, partial [Bacteroidota bacterium]|nr:hypothetical protein [Bacteroidota bacterium]